MRPAELQPQHLEGRRPGNDRQVWASLPRTIPLVRKCGAGVDDGGMPAVADDVLSVTYDRAVGCLGSGAAFFIYKRSEEHTSELQSLMRTSYVVFCLKKQKEDNEH